jgi:hypothetical protein
MPNRMIMQKFYDISKKKKRFKSIYQSDGKPFKQFRKSTIPPLNKSTIQQLHH